MQNFLVLGLVPGTHFQITFTMWLGFVLVLAAVRWSARERYTLKAWVLAGYAAILIRRRHLA